MFIGLVLQDYKCYKGIKFIPFVNSTPKSLNVIIGNNGVGKSAILEAMDTFFNNQEWIINVDASIRDSKVGLFFLIDKVKINTILNDKGDSRIIEQISSGFWNVLVSTNSAYSQTYSKFFIIRDSLKDKYEDSHYLFLLANQYNSKDVHFLGFQGVVNEAIKSIDPKPNIVTLSNIRDKILHYFSYLYIPVESSVSDFLKLEARGMQLLMDRDIKNTISEHLNKKRITRRLSDDKNKKLSLLEIVNEKLEQYIDEVETQIKSIESSYNFKPGYRQNTKLTANHLTDVIVEAYYTKRSLKKGKKPIATLSSGEKRRALIDIICVFLSNSKEKGKELIIAIDEPESSLHISKCYEQFERIHTISNVHDYTIFIATHWYGGLPIMNKGTLIHLSDDTIYIFDLANYFEKRREHPDDIHFKSFFDLSSSILSSLRNHNCNWLLVEGTEDKKYIEYYINTDEKRIKVLPLGGCSIVEKIYEYLYAPISQKKKQDEVNNTENKILCLVDTDNKCNNLHINESETANNLLQIRRLNPSMKDSSIIELFKLSDKSNRIETEIEEVLEPDKFYKALSISIKTNGSAEEIEAFEAFDFDKTVKISRIKGDYSILNPKILGRNIRNDKQIIIDFVNKSKGIIADEYVKFYNDNSNTPHWILQVSKFFES